MAGTSLIHSSATAGGVGLLWGAMYLYRVLCYKGLFYIRLWGRGGKERKGVRRLDQFLLEKV